MVLAEHCLSEFARVETASIESLRLHTLASYAIMDTGPEREFDDLTALAVAICQTPVALVSLVDEERQWFKSNIGIEVCQTSRDIAFCAHALLQTKVLEVYDARNDIRFALNPLVTGAPGIRFYAGAPLISPNGAILGTLCVIDFVPRRLSEAQRDALYQLARQVVAQLEWRRSRLLLAQQLDKVQSDAEQFKQQKSALEQANFELVQLVSTDCLTGLHNRHALEHDLKREWASAQRRHTPLSLLMLDVDHFKRINDRFGHLIGDEVLKQVAQIMRRNLRTDDSCARWGGEEFVVLLPHTTAEEARALAERLREAVNDLRCDDWPVSVSIGCSVSSEVGSSAELLLAADRLMYCAKQRGRNRVL